MNILRKSYLSAFMGALFAVFSVVQARDLSLVEACLKYIKYQNNYNGRYTNTDEKAIREFKDIVRQNSGIPQELLENAVNHAENLGYDVVVDSPEKEENPIVDDKVKTDDATKGVLFLAALKVLGKGFGKMCKESLPGFADASTFLVKGTGQAFNFISEHKTASTVCVGVGAYLLYCWWMKSSIIRKNWNGAFEPENKPAKTTTTVMYNG